MLYQGIIGGGSSPVEPVDLSPVLLWTNPSPTSQFAGQKVSLNLTDYAGVIVEFNSDSYGIFSSRSYLKKNEEINTSYFGAGFAKDTEGGVGRRYTINDTGVTFENGYYLKNSNNGVMIPTKIYGVKEYVVEPAVEQTTITNIKTGYVESATLQTLTVNCEFKPKEVVVIQNGHGGYINNGKKCYEYSDSNGIKESTALNITANGFTMLSSVPFYWMAYN